MEDLIVLTGQVSSRINKKTFPNNARNVVCNIFMEGWRCINIPYIHEFGIVACIEKYDCISVDSDLIDEPSSKDYGKNR